MTARVLGSGLGLNEGPESNEGDGDESAVGEARGRDGRRWMPKQYGAKNVPIENASSVLSRSPC